MMQVHSLLHRLYAVTLEDRVTIHNGRWSSEAAFYDRRATFFGVLAAKVWAILTMFASAVLLLLLDVPSWLQLGAPVMMAVVAVWLWRRPES
jgi:uncharacterized membrane protein YbaN (DUF454 family)